jgi:hypothetical protein
VEKVFAVIESAVSVGPDISLHNRSRRENAPFQFSTNALVTKALKLFCV